MTENDTSAPTLTAADAFTAWLAGDLPATTTYRAILQEYAGVEAASRALDVERARLRALLEPLARVTGPQEESGYRVEVTRPSVRCSAPIRDVQALIRAWRASAPERSAELAGIVQETEVSGALRVTPLSPRA